MNRFNQKTRESALQKEIVVLKDENNKLRHELQLMKDALLMELTEKKNQS
jgi:cell division protein FtsB